MRKPINFWQTVILLELVPIVAMNMLTVTNVKLVEHH